MGVDEERSPRARYCQVFWRIILGGKVNDDCLEKPYSINYKFS